MDAPDIILLERIHQHFKRSGLRLSVAESCTGGLIGHLLTSLPGASDFFDSSVVCYSNECKIKLLGIASSIISKHGVISEEVAREMAISMRRISGTDFSLSTTGNLGPGAMEDKQVGLVYMAVDWKRETFSRGMMFEGERESIKYQAAVNSLQFLMEVFEVWS